MVAAHTKVSSIYVVSSMPCSGSTLMHIKIYTCPLSIIHLCRLANYRLRNVLPLKKDPYRALFLAHFHFGWCALCTVHANTLMHQEIGKDRTKANSLVCFLFHMERMQQVEIFYIVLGTSYRCMERKSKDL